MLETKSFDFYLKWIIIIATVARCLIAYMVELGNDEVYYFTYAVQPDWNHFDHPPMVGLFIRLFTLNLHWINDLSVRLPAIVGAAINTWLIARCGMLISNQRTGLIAAILYNTSLYTSIISGLFILPDSIQLVFWLAALHTMIRIVSNENPTSRNKNILVLGMWIGLAIMCKVHGVFLWLGILSYILFFKRSLLTNPWLYGSMALTCLIISPIFFWNIDNQFISWRFHSERVEANKGLNLASFFTTTVGQIAYNNPVNFFIFILTLTGILRREYFVSIPVLRLILWCSLPIIAATTVVSLFRTTLPHWSGPGFIGLILLSAAFIDFKLNLHKKLYGHLLKSSVILIIAVMLSGVSLINYYPGTLSTRPEPKTGSGDFTLDMYGWKSLSTAFNQLRLNDIKTGKMTVEAPLITHKWFPGGHLFYYVAYPAKIPLIGIGNLNDLHKFIWLNASQGSVSKGGDAYFITSSTNFTSPDDLYKNDFERIEQPQIVEQLRNGKIARYWYIYRLKNATKNLPKID